jgi:hypothetical protein
MRYVHPQQEEKKRAMEKYESAMKRKQLRKVIEDDYEFMWCHPGTTNRLPSPL